MAIYERPVWELLQDFARQRSGDFRLADVSAWFQTRYPAIQERTLRAHVQRMTVGTASDGLPKLFVRVEHGLYRSASVAEAPAQSVRSTPAPTVAAQADVVLVTCVKKKGSVPAAAQDLYISSLFKRQRLYAERAAVPWFILSAEYGLVRPHDWISPYERYLPDCSSDYQRAWAAWVAVRLELLMGGLRGVSVEIHASSLYASCVTPELTRLGAFVSAPLTGLSQGRRLSWYDDRLAHAAPAPERTTESALLDERSLSALATALEAKLKDEASARRPAAIRAAGRTELSAPGMYSWWVDDAGADDLSDGLGLTVPPGLIYVGQAGATRWPSGRRSMNTLWSRLVGMHLDGSADFSTFRLTLASILREPLRLNHLDDSSLTTWMEDHLQVATAPVDDGDGLMAVEREVLARLDPPLNLAGRPPSPLRRQLSTLRKQAGAEPVADA